MEKNGLILWLLLGTGVLLMYSAYKNVMPISLLLQELGQSQTVTPIAAITPEQGPVSLTPNGKAVPASVPSGYMDGPLYIRPGGKPVAV
jgi:hypothetical protein